MGVDQPLVWFEGSGVLDTARRYLYADERGSIVAVTDSVGAVQSINRYDEYGIPDLAGSIGVEISTKGRFRYTGQAYIPEMGMYYYKARMYSPTLGRFMQTDPIGYGDGANMYNYVRSDPVNGADPSGLIRNGTNTCSNASIAPPPQGWICSDGEWVQGFEINGISCHTDPTQWACATPGVSYVDPSTFLKNFGMNSVNPGTSYSGDGGGTASQGVCPPGTAANTGGKADFSGVATMYGETIKGKADQFAGETTASGEKMDPDAMTAASVRLRDAKGNLQRSPLIRLGTSLVVSLVSDSSKSIVVRINDTGPLRPGRILDLTPAAMKALTGKAYNEVSVNAYRCKPVPQ